jgi:hypothetical protein
MAITKRFDDPDEFSAPPFLGSEPDRIIKIG